MICLLTGFDPPTLSQARRDEAEQRPWITQTSLDCQSLRPVWAGPVWAGPVWAGPGFSSLDLLTRGELKNIPTQTSSWLITLLVSEPVASFTGPPRWLLRPRRHRLIGPERLTSSGKEREARCTSTVRERERERSEIKDRCSRARSKTEEIKDSTKEEVRVNQSGCSQR